VSARLSYCPLHVLYVYAGMVRWLRGQNYQRGYLASKFTRFFFWGCLKDKVYKSNPRMEELKENIRREITKIPAEQLQK
jgi:hypothetical protein